MRRWLVWFACGRVLNVDAGSPDEARRRAYYLDRSGTIIRINEDSCSLRAG
jgi:hypothetical protein